MERARKITIEIRPELLEKAQRASGTGITQDGTLRTLIEDDLATDEQRVRR